MSKMALPQVGSKFDKEIFNFIIDTSNQLITIDSLLDFYGYKNYQTIQTTLFNLCSEGLVRTLNVKGNEFIFAKRKPKITFSVSVQIC